MLYFDFNDVQYLLIYYRTTFYRGKRNSRKHTIARFTILEIYSAKKKVNFR